MKPEINWLSDALAEKDIVVAMTHYRVKDRTMTATNGRIVAGYPCDIDGEFLVPGEELAAILKRLPDEPKIKLENDCLVLRSGRFSGSLQMLPQEDWRFPELEDVTWKPFPQDLIPILKDLRPFISENAVHRWSLGVAIDNGWCYASNNIVLAGAPFTFVSPQVLIPLWVIEFVLSRAQGLAQWAITGNHMAFKWANGAWMRSTLIDDKFPARAGDMIRETPRCSQPITPDYRKAVTRVAELSDETVYVYADRTEGRTARSLCSEALVSEIPTRSPFSLWSSKHVSSIMGVATSWSPSQWPSPVPFHGDRIRGYIAGRTG